MIGKFCFSKKRAFLFYLALSLPIFFGVLYSFRGYQELKDSRENFFQVCKKGKTAIERKQKKEAFIQKYSSANPYFLDEHVESFVFLKNEISDLDKLLRHPAVSEKRVLSSRLDFLKNGGNKLEFMEESIRSNGKIKETDEKQKHPTQMNGEDIKELLATLENQPVENYPISENRPQIVITDFRLEKRKTPFSQEVFEVDMQFLKREFSP